MAPKPPSSAKLAGPTLFAAMLAIAVMVLPLLFGQKITASPLLLCATAVMPNFMAYLIPAGEDEDSRLIFSRTFYLRVAASVACAVLLLAIYRIAYAFG